MCNGWKKFPKNEFFKICFEFCQIMPEMSKVDQNTECEVNYLVEEGGNYPNNNETQEPAE